METDCAVYEDLILASLEERFHPADRLRLEAHLAHCEACPRFLAAQTELEAVLARGLARPSLPPQFEKRLRRAIARERWQRRLEAFFVSLEPVAAMVVVAAFGYGLGSLVSATTIHLLGS